jgi:cobalt-zinc-cadmium efflux system outer membrane protein
MAQLARADSIRLKAGEATALDALQSSLEARSKLTEVHQSLSDMQNSAVQLLFLAGKQYNDTLNIPSDDFPYAVRDFSLAELIKTALEKRIELLVAIKNREVSEKNLKLIRAQRSFEFDIEAGYAYNSIVTNEIAPAPEHNSITAGISVPLKFSSLNKGERKAAEIAIQQSQNIAEEAELQVTSEVVMAYNNFTNQNKKLVSYNQGLIEDAERILQGRIYSYRNGETGLLDVLNAQRTYTELHMSYIQALFDYTAALIDLERAAGFWDGLL